MTDAVNTQSSTGSRRVPGLLLVVCCLLSYVALAIALTWPLVRELDTAVADHGDPLLNAWIIDWNCHALSHDPLHLFDAPIFRPAEFPLAFSEHMTGVALLVLPFHLAGFSAVATYNIALLISFALSGFGMFLLARLISGDTIASFAAGVFYAFVSFKFDHLSHVQIIASGWIPLTLAALLLFWRSGSAKHAALFTIAFVMNGLTNVYWLLFTGVAVVATIVFLHLVRPFQVRRLAVALVASFLLLLPFLIPYQVVSKTYRMRRNSMESTQGSASWQDWIGASPSSLLYGSMSGRPERRIFPGFLALALLLYGVLSSRPRIDPSIRIRKPLAIAALLLLLAGCVLLRWHKSDVAFMPAVLLAIAAIPFRKYVVRAELWVASLWIAIGFAGSFGEHSFLHSFLFRVFEPMRATRSPARWAIIAYCGLGIWMAVSASRLPRLRFAVLALSIIEVLPRFTWQHVPRELPPVYAWLASARPSCMIELPVGWDEREASYLLASTRHRIPTMNGVSGFDPPVHELLRIHRYDDAMLDVIAKNGATVVVIHPEAAEKARKWIDSGRLRELVRFPDGDAVYSITRAEPAGSASAPRG